MIVEFHKSEVLLIASTLLVVKAEYIIKMQKTMKTEFSHQTAYRNSVPCHKDVH